MSASPSIAKDTLGTFRGIPLGVLEGGREPEAFTKRRRQAAEKFEQMGLPTTRLESWKYTSLLPLAEISFGLAKKATPLSEDQLQKLGGLSGTHRLVFVNGYFSQSLSDLSGLPASVMAQSFSSLMQSGRLPTDRVGSLLSSNDHALSALNLASFREGAVVQISKGVSVEKPIEVLMVCSPEGSQPQAVYPRLLVVAEEGSSVNLVEHYVSESSQVYLTDSVCEVVVGPNAKVNHYKVQREGTKAFHISSLRADVARGGSLTSHFFSYGGSVVRNDVAVSLSADTASCGLNGLFLANKDQHIDSFTSIDHRFPNTTSEELYKGILDGHSTGVFQGRIVVHKDAQKTDARQTNKNLLLSQEATINSKPQLEIYANDVKCSHGATIGRLEEESLFYLRSRGIDPESAKEMLTFAFAADLIERVGVPSIRESLLAWLRESLVGRSR